MNKNKWSKIEGDPPQNGSCVLVAWKEKGCGVWQGKLIHYKNDKFVIAAIEKHRYNSIEERKALEKEEKKELRRIRKKIRYWIFIPELPLR